MTPAESVELLLLPELAAWKAVDPRGAALRGRILARDRQSFSRAALGLVAGWLARHAGLAPTWVWSVGDAHHQHFTTLATGRLRRDGLPAVTYGVNALDQQHPAPWTWDVLRLAASVADRRSMRQAELAAFVATLLGDYLRCWSRIADGDGEAALRIDLHGLPEALKRHIEVDSEPDAVAAHLRRHCRRAGAQRLARGPAMSDDPAAAAELGRRFALALRARPSGGHELLDLVRLSGRDAHSGALLGWLGLLRERERSGGWRLRLLRFAQREARVLPGLLPQLGGGPRSALGDHHLAAAADPYQLLLPDPVRPYLVRSWCHARHALAVATLDGGDLRRLAQLWGQLLAGFHATGLGALGIAPAERAAPIAADAAQYARELPLLAGALSHYTARAHAHAAARLRPERAGRARPTP